MNIIEEKRKELGITVTGLARRVGVSRNTIHNWQNKTTIPDGNKINILAKILGIKPEEILKDYK